MKMGFCLSVILLTIALSGCATGPVQVNQNAGRQQEVPVLYGSGNTSGSILQSPKNLPEPDAVLGFYRVYPYKGRLFRLSLDLSKKMLEPDLKKKEKKTIASLKEEKKSDVKPVKNEKTVLTARDDSKKTAAVTENSRKKAVPEIKNKQVEPRKKTESAAVEKTKNPPVATETTKTKETLQTVKNPETREVLARPGDDIEINFDKTGWYFSGFTNPADVQGVNFVKKEATNKATNFSFKALKIGDYDLKFNFQDNTGGKVYEENVMLKVLSDRDFSTAMDGMESGKLASNDEINRGDELFASGKYSQALETYLKNYKETSPLMNEKIASAYMKMRDFPRAIDFWKKNLEAGKDFRQNALRNLVSLSMLLDDPENGVKYGALLSADKSENTQADLLSLIRYLQKKDRNRDALDLMSSFNSNFPGSRSLDEIYFRLGRLYEKDTPFRDFTRSRECYTKVVEEYPGSSFVKDAADRIQYLNRYVFFIR
jgi:hypothetical protein